jgi:phage shock protein A
MSLITRFVRLCRADLNALLDHIEEPETLLKLSLREMEEALDEDRRRSQTLSREREQLAAAIAERERAVQTLIAETAMCLDADQDNLARVTVKRRLEAERQLKILGQRQTSLQAEQADLQIRIEENRKRLDAVREQAEALAPGGYGDDDHWPGAVADDEIELALLREKLNREAKP